MIIDDGVPSRGHRKNIFLPDYVSASIGIWEFSELSVISIFDYHVNYIECMPENINGKNTQSPEKKKRVIEVPGVDRQDLMRDWPEGKYKELEINAFIYQSWVRLNPQEAIEDLEDRLYFFADETDLTYMHPLVNQEVKTSEGMAAIKDAIEFLRNLEPKASLKVGPMKLVKSGRKQALICSGMGGITYNHETKGDAEARIERVVPEAGNKAETIMGHLQVASAEDIVLGLLIGDGDSK